MTQTSAPGRVLNLGALSLEICFGLRASDFGFGRQHPCKKLRCARPRRKSNPGLDGLGNVVA